MSADSPATVLLTGAPIDPALLGGRGHALNQLIATGAHVPPTGAITSAGYHWFVEESGLSGFLNELASSAPTAPIDLDHETARVDEAFLNAQLPRALADEIRRLSATVRGAELVAVRSSATAEDTAAASFTGQYQSFLKVNETSLLEAVRLVWASLWHPAVRASRAHASVSEVDLAMAVVMMRMVDAVRAGVAFTVNPIGEPTDMRIEAVDGLAEQLVSGEVTPDAWVVPRIEAHRSTIDPVIDEIVDVALDIEHEFGAPQDVQWAHDGEHLFIVQARPITTDPIAMPRDGFDSVIGNDDTCTTVGIA